MDFEDDDYEALPSSSSIAHHMFAGACAGIMEHLVMYPVDSVKTRMQCLRPIVGSEYRTVTQGLYQLIRYEGFFRSLRGIGAVVGGAGPAHAAYFGSYEYVKKHLKNPPIGSSPLAYSIGGACATLLHDAFMTPADAIKQRLQMYNSPYHNSFDCLRRICLTEGPSILYRAYFTQLSMNVPYQAIHFVSYEALQNILNPSGQYMPSSHVISGGIAGGLAAVCTTPLDVCKTLLNTQDEYLLVKSAASQTWTPLEVPVRGLFGAVRLIFKLEGLRGFMRGSTARVISAIPGAAISWSVYEYFKWLFTKSIPSSCSTVTSSIDPPPCLSSPSWFPPSSEVACAATITDPNLNNRSGS